MNKFNKRIVVLILGLILLPLLVIQIRSQKVKNAKAYGNLTVDYGQINKGDPMFYFDDFKPGDCAFRKVTITNNSESQSIIYVRSENIQNSNNLTDALYFSIYDEVNYYYYGVNNSKTLTNFYNESTYPGIPLFTLLPGETITITFSVCFEITSGNEYQTENTVFDIVFSEEPADNGLPKECTNLVGLTYTIVHGTEGDDDLHSTYGHELIFLYGGNDTLDSSTGNDCIIGTGGNKIIESESGDDVIVLSGLGDDDIETGSENDTVYAGSGNDTIDTGTGDDIIYAGDGDDEVEAGGENDLIYAGAGNDIIDAETGNDTVYGESGNDYIKGSTGNDTIYAGVGDDNIKGNSGNDYIDGGSNYDILDGGSDTDTCINWEEADSCEL